ncbi:arylsulfatase B-like [Physella acuta]|uniref:arylsulfatase B-like n=1 Tax=Physella acuta TaxID=109671 RepID=UPI0027DE90DE|nr:arylsulfatase B-like [Physella acuta]
MVYRKTWMLFLSVVVWLQKCVTLKTHTPPHIVFIVADDLGWNDVSWHNSDLLTPNLERLARNGIILDSSYALPSCTPSRNSYMTGMYPFHTRPDPIEPPEPYYIPLKFPLLPERLKQLGYSTHMVGKWHLGFCNEKYTPTRRGFDSFFGFYIGSQCHYYHDKAGYVQNEDSINLSLKSPHHVLVQSLLAARRRYYVTGKDFRFNDTIWRETEGTYSTIAFANRAVDIIKRHDPEVPLFLYLPFQAPHTPVTVPYQYSQLYKNIASPVRRVYSGMVSAIDEAVGNITRALYEKGFMDNLLLVFTSDNGGQPEMGGNNWPLRGAKSSVWEGGTRVPTFVYSESLLQRRRYVSNELLHSVDWFPTFLEAAGGRPERGIDGKSQWSMLTKGQPSGRNEFVYQISSDGKGALRMGDHKLLVGKPGHHNGWYAPPSKTKISKWHYKGGKFDSVAYTNDEYQLYNIREDPAERTNIAKDYPEITRKMLRRFQYHNSTKVPAFKNMRAGDGHSDPGNYGGFWSPGWC